MNNNKCTVCGRNMFDWESGDEFPDECVCDQCAGITHITAHKMYMKRNDAPEHADAIERLVNAGCDGGNGEYDAHVDALVHARFQFVIEWETDNVSFDTHNVILHNAHVAICP